MTVELGTILGLSAFVFLSVVGLAWRIGRVEGRLIGVERSVERLHVDIDRIRDDMNRLWDDVRAVFLRLPAKAE